MVAGARLQAGRLDRKLDEKELSPLQVELLKMQYGVKASGFRLIVIVIVAGRDAACKGGTVKRITKPLNPRGCRVGGPRHPLRSAAELSAVQPLEPEPRKLVGAPQEGQQEQPVQPGWTLGGLGGHRWSVLGTVGVQIRTAASP